MNKRQFYRSVGVFTVAAIFAICSRTSYANDAEALSKAMAQSYYASRNADGAASMAPAAQQPAAAPADVAKPMWVAPAAMPAVMPTVQPQTAPPQQIPETVNQPVAIVPDSYDAPPKLDLGTRSGVEVGVQVSDYRYQEHVFEHPEFIHQLGVKSGITLTGTKASSAGYFVTGDARFAFSENHYSSSGSGTKDNNPDYLGEVRFLGGKDFVLRNFAFSPYLGLGYRNLYNDLTGRTSANSIGYGRDSQYLYMPFGLTSRFRVNESGRMAVNVEYDQLLHGWQKSYLSDAGLGLSDVSNDQTSGRGIRGSIMYEQPRWSVGPFFDYWNIDQSNVSSYLGLYEPHNQTIEYGLQARYLFR